MFYMAKTVVAKVPPMCEGGETGACWPRESPQNFERHPIDDETTGHCIKGWGQAFLKSLRHSTYRRRYLVATVAADPGHRQSMR